MANEPTESAAPVSASETAAPVTESVVIPSSESSAPITTFLDGESAPVTPASEPVEIPAVEPSAVPEVEPAPVIAPTPEIEKPVEGDKPLEAKPDQTVEPAPLPVYEPWVVPETITLDETLSGEFNQMLGELQNSTKAEQAFVQKFGQTLVDKHIAVVGETVDRLHEAYTHAWQKQTDGWRESFIKDPEIGGKRQETTIRQANEFIDTHGGTPEQKAAFREVMKNTGLGVHPEVLRLLSNAMNRFREGRPLPANAPRIATASKTQRMYGKKTG